MKHKVEVFKYKLKRNDEVVVITGSDKGKRGKVLQTLPERNRIIIEGVAMRKRHQKPSQDNQEGGIVEREGSIHYSNVMKASKFDAKQEKRK